MSWAHTICVLPASLCAFSPPSAEIMKMHFGPTYFRGLRPQTFRPRAAPPARFTSLGRMQSAIFFACLYTVLQKIWLTAKHETFEKLDQRTRQKTQKRCTARGAHPDSIQLHVRRTRPDFEKGPLWLTPHPAPTPQAPHHCRPRHLLHGSPKQRRLTFLQQVNSHLLSLHKL